MRFTQSQISEILEELTNQEDGMNQLLRMSLEAIMKAERSEHNRQQRDVSNGYRPRKSLGRGKIIELQVPRTRKGNFKPALLALIKDQEEECRRIAFSLYGAGLTTEQVGELFDELYGRHYSTSSVSRMFDYAREEVDAWLNRPLEGYYPIVYIDATYIATRRVDSVMKEAYYTILGVRADRTREVLAVVNFPTESAKAWQEVFLQLKQRGVQQINLVVCDGLRGIENSIISQYSMAEIQLCAVHLQRNVQKYVRPKDKEQVASDFKEVFTMDNKQDSLEQAWSRWLAFCNTWGAKYRSIANMGNNERYRLYFTCFNYDYRMRNMIYTTNWIERLNRDYKRVTKMRGALPNPDATLLLLGRVAMTRKAYDRKVPKLNYETTKFNWED